MTIRRFGEMGIKLLGVYFAASAVLGLASVLSILALPQIEGLPAASRVMALNLGAALSSLVGVALIISAPRLAVRLDHTVQRQR